MGLSIVVGYTDSTESRAALHRGAAEARLRSAELHIVQVVRQGTTADPNHLAAWTEHADRVRRMGERLSQRLRDEGLDVRYHFRQAYSESVARELISVAGDVDAQLIVIGLRRRSRVGKLVVGSVAQQVLLSAECPVLAVRASG